MERVLRDFIRLCVCEGPDDNVIEDTETETDEDLQAEFCSVGGAGAIGQFGWAVPLGGKSNAAAVEKKAQRKKKKK